jgi:hypothetical protein
MYDVGLKQETVKDAEERVHFIAACVWWASCNAHKWWAGFLITGDISAALLQA